LVLCFLDTVTLASKELQQGIHERALPALAWKAKEAAQRLLSQKELVAAEGL